MSKNIKAGTWWLDADGDIIYVGSNRSHLPFATTEDDEEDCVEGWFKLAGESKARCIWMTEPSLVREFPDCTGFDYEVPQEPSGNPKAGLVEGSPTWVPITGADGREYLFLGYEVKPVDATAG